MDDTRDHGGTLHLFLCKHFVRGLLRNILFVGFIPRSGVCFEVSASQDASAEAANTQSLFARHSRLARIGSQQPLSAFGPRHEIG